MKSERIRKIAADVLFHYFICTRRFLWKKKKRKELVIINSFQVICADLLHNFPYISINDENLDWSVKELCSVVHSLIDLTIELEQHSDLRSKDIKTYISHFRHRLNLVSRELSQIE
ncbi:hypothetical protein [Enterococcus sp. BWR-S5]|uniref:hypothetical protein n=1 Tax=Enterococcus sp. BWR-S5 TaxID=2787714 RepID=UPI0019206813|nr:hypothetical protein [Enterococcus sp. BWR-S5]MBL1226491.1 hypothetical protein [Enterococcus sp. BWR-S5]